MVDPKEKIYYYFKLDSSTYVLYDGSMGTPLMDKMAKGYGSLALVGGIISRLPSSSMIYYFEKDVYLGFKLKRTYSPDKTAIDTKEKKNISKKEDDKKKA